jgi:hypothetical protein
MEGDLGKEKALPRLVEREEKPKLTLLGCALVASGTVSPQH